MAANQLLGLRAISKVKHDAATAVAGFSHVFVVK
jgi:hypothetical protein